MSGENELNKSIQKQERKASMRQQTVMGKDSNKMSKEELKS